MNTATATSVPFFTSAAAEAGRKAGLAVLAGKMPIEKAADKWEIFANKSHTAGENFLRAFDATGAQR